MLVVVGFFGQLPFGLGTFFKVFGGISAWWVGAATFGTATLIIIDTVVSRWGARFRTRLTLAILWLVVGFAMAGGLFLSLASLAANAVAAAVAKETDSLSPVLGYSKEEVSGFIQSNPVPIALLAFFVVGAIAVPAVLSTCSKLADAAMERLRPMMRGFTLVSEGQRGVRVEEAGSTEFIELAQSFNRLVETLAVSEKMERAFGRYVSGQVLSRIRSQHGEAELPPSLREATVFRFQQKIFVKGPQLRKRFKCKCLNDRRIYFIDPTAEVQVEQPVQVRRAS